MWSELTFAMQAAAPKTVLRNSPEGSGRNRNLQIRRCVRSCPGLSPLKVLL